MSKLTVDISVSLDGYVAGPSPSAENPLGVGGDTLHEWTVATETFQQVHGRSGGESGVDDEINKEMFENTGAWIMGRKMFSGGEGPWESDSNADGWWGDAPPFRNPVFVLTHHSRETVKMKNGTSFTFVTDGIESALTQARKAAADKDILIGGGAKVIQQYLQDELVDELRLHVVPVFLGGGESLFGSGHTPSLQKWTLVRVVESPTGVIHSKYRVRKSA